MTTVFSWAIMRKGEIMKSCRLFNGGMWALVLMVISGVIALSDGALARGPSDEGWYDPDTVDLPREQLYKGMNYSSQYLTMRDGVKIAVDLYLPKGLETGKKIPTILRQTRYFRSIELRAPYRWFLGGKPYDHTTLYDKRRKRFVGNGYAWVDVDTRGSGASYGTRLASFSPLEVRDGAEVVDWIVSQTWSNKKVGSTGISYPGTTAELLLVNKHPAVKAVAPRFALFDSYTDIVFPGGIHATYFTEKWRRNNSALDRNAPHERAGWWVRLLVTGVQPVDEDRDRSLRAEAIRDHLNNYDVHANILTITYRDDIAPSDPRFHGKVTPEDLGLLAAEPMDPEGSIGLVSPHNYTRDVEASGAAIYSYTGWFDGAYPHAAMKRFLTVRNPGSRMIIGPWNHGGGWNTDPLEGVRRSRFDHDAEILRFFNYHLKGIDTGIMDEKPIHYFTMVEGKWKTADTWPPPEAVKDTYYFTDGNTLSPQKPVYQEGYDEYTVDYTAKTTEESRWRTQVGIDPRVKYPNRKNADKKLLVYTAPPLERDMEVTGHPIISLYVSSTAQEGSFFVYLEDVDEKGRVHYITEGELQAIHRKLSNEEPPYKHVVPYRTFKRRDARTLVPGEVAELVFDLLPTSYVFLKGHSIRIALAGADVSHFTNPPGNPPTVRFYRNSLFPSHIDLPVIAGTALASGQQ